MTSMNPPGDGLESRLARLAVAVADYAANAPSLMNQLLADIKELRGRVRTTRRQWSPAERAALERLVAAAARDKLTTADHRRLERLVGIRRPTAARGEPLLL